MASLNKVLLMGNLTREPALRFTPGGTAVCEFGLAINRRFVVNGQEKDETCFVDITVWGKQAESCGRYLSKGSPAFVEGRLQLDQWDDKETGAKRSKLRIIAERVQFLGSSKGAAADGASQEYNDDMDASIDSEAAQQHYAAPPQSRPAYQQPPRQQQKPAAPQHGGGYNNQNAARQAPPPMPPHEAFNGEPEDDIPF